MIASLRGTISYTTPQLRKESYVVVDVQGVGYKVHVPSHVITTVTFGAEQLFYIHMAVSEHALDLYGFTSPAEKTFFVLLLTVPGIGPKTALGILDKATMQEVQEAAMGNDPQLLVTSAGLGLKTAEKIVVALKDKVESLSGTSENKKQKSTSGADDAFQVLLTFGYSAAEAKEALQQVDPEIQDASARVRLALKQLGKK